MPDVEKQLREYILCPENLPIHDYESAQQHWPRTPNPSSLYNYELSPVGTILKVDRDLTTGALTGFREVQYNGEPLPTPTNADINDVTKLLETVDISVSELNKGMLSFYSIHALLLYTYFYF